MKVIIIGGGAAGLVAGITAAKKGADVTILEKENKPGKKILITGNGKCNITNTDLNGEKYYGDREFVKSVIHRFGYRETIDFFRQCGVVVKNKNGYIYPRSEQAVTVFNMLRDAALNFGVKIKTNNPVTKIQKKTEGFDVDVGIVLHCDKLIIATGGMAAPKTGSDGTGFKLAASMGHHIIEPKPGLTGLVCEKNSLNKAAGVRTSATVAVIKNDVILRADTGELQITDYGISGIPVFNISRLAEKDTYVRIDFIPEMNHEQTKTTITELLESGGFRPAAAILNGLLNEKLAIALLESVHINKNERAENITPKQVAALTEAVKNYLVSVKSTRGFAYAQVTQGGVDTNEINPGTMESLLVKDLHFAGEVIDVDGICGGYNLQFAWATGAIAGGNCFS